MQKIELKQLEHNVKIGDVCTHLEPNVTEDTMFLEDGVPIGFYISNISDYSEKGTQFATIANSELRSKNVPKSAMKRSSGFIDKDKSKEVLQYSTIIGSVPPKPHMRRPYPTRSSVHNVKSARNFIKAMLLLCRESENIIKELIPQAYEKQVELIKENVPEKWRFGNMFTSSISNFNISAPYHRDTGNIKQTVNVIICKQEHSKGGDLNVPDYGATIGQVDNSMLVYPAWKNVHGVTPIVRTKEQGYRNSLVFYPLAAFKNH
jgi:hypothetical protein